MDEAACLANSCFRKGRVQGMATIRKRGKSYEITVSLKHGPDGKQRRAIKMFHPTPGLSPYRQLKEAQAFAAAFEEEKKSMPPPEPDNCILFKNLAERYLEYTNGGNGIEATTHAGYAQTIRLRLIPFFGEMRAASIRRADLLRYELQMRQDGVRHDGKPGGLSRSTITKDLRVLSSVLEYGISAGDLDSNSVVASGRLRHKKNYEKGDYKTSMNTFTESQMKTYLYYISHAFHIEYGGREYIRKGKNITTKPYVVEYQAPPMHVALLTLFITAGNRRGEGVALKWKNIDLKEGTISFDSSIANAYHKQYEKGTKSGAGRKVAVPQITIQALEKWKEEQISLSKQAGWKGKKGRLFDENWVFTNRDGSNHIHVDTPYGIFEKFCALFNRSEECKKDPTLTLPKIRLHDNRHTVATIQALHGVPINIVSAELGHSDPSVTARIYVHQFRNADRTGADIMDKILNSPDKLLDGEDPVSDSGSNDLPN